MVTHLVLISIVYAWFWHITQPSPLLQPALHSVFGMAAIASLALTFLCSRWTPQRRWEIAMQLTNLTIFGVLWSIGTVLVTRAIAASMIADEGVDGVMLYGSSGTQFLTYRDAVLCWFLLLTIAIIYSVFFICRKFLKAVLH